MVDRLGGYGEWEKVQGVACKLRLKEPKDTDEGAMDIG